MIVSQSSRPARRRPPLTPELVAPVRAHGVADRRADVLEAADIARAAPAVILAAHENEALVVAGLDPKRTADDLPADLRPALAVSLDRMPRLRATVGPVHDA